MPYQYNRQLYHFELPERLIARYPLANRSQSRLLKVDGDNLQHLQFSDFYQWLEPSDVVVFNNTKVIPARLYATKPSGGQVEVLIERIIDNNSVLAHIKASKSPRPASKINIGKYEVEVVGREGNFFKLHSDSDWTTIVDTMGHIPLPPYLQRDAEVIDRERYQTVYAKHLGAVAAPTAGLHFDDDYRQQLQSRDVKMAEVTLHVGAGTFQPVRVEDIRQHRMHAEWFSIDQANCDIINRCRASGGRVVAIGTTAVRVLESASRQGIIKPTQRDTNIFIAPGYQFQMVDCMVTNFHLPESTLLILVSAFSGLDTILNAYNEAIKQRYRFYSYGDAMLLMPQLKRPHF